MSKNQSNLSSNTIDPIINTIIGFVEYDIKIWKIHFCGWYDECDHFYDRYIKADTKSDVINILFHKGEFMIILMLLHNNIEKKIFTEIIGESYKNENITLTNTIIANIKAKKELIVNLLIKHGHSDIEHINILS